MERHTDVHNGIHQLVIQLRRGERARHHHCFESKLHTLSAATRCGEALGMIQNIVAELNVVLRRLKAQYDVAVFISHDTEYLVPASRVSRRSAAAEIVGLSPEPFGAMSCEESRHSGRSSQLRSIPGFSQPTHVLQARVCGADIRLSLRRVFGPEAGRSARESVKRIGTVVNEQQ